MEVVLQMFSVFLPTLYVIWRKGTTTMFELLKCSQYFSPIVGDMEEGYHVSQYFSPIVGDMEEGDHV